MTMLFKLRRVSFIILCVFLMGFVSLPAKAEEPFCEGESDLMEVFARAQEEKAEEFRFLCSRELFDEILKEQSDLLDRAKYQNNILNATIRYYQSGLFEVSDITYEKIYWAQCSTEEQALEALRAYTGGDANERAEVVVLFTEETLWKQLFDNNHLFAFAALSGIDRFELSYSLEGHFYFLKNITFLEDPPPFSYVKKEEDYSSAVYAFADQGISEFTLLFEESFFRELENNPDRMRILRLSAGISTCESSISPDFCYIKYHNVTFFDGPTYFCETKEELKEILKAADAPLFRIGLTEKLYRRLMDNDLAELCELEAEAGIISYSRFYYSNTDYTISYENPVFAAHMADLSSLEEAKEFFSGLPEDADPEQSIHCSAELFELLLSDEEGNSVENTRLGRIYDLLAENGFFDMQISYDTKRHAIHLLDCVHSPGTRIILAIRNDNTGILSEREQDALKAAREIAEEAKEKMLAFSGDEPDEEIRKLRIAQNIHDSLCERVEYLIDEADEEDDSAIGALLNGLANCDGYSDAFYLIGTLAGLEVSFQHGDSRDDEFAGQPESSHLWNLLKLNGTWRMVDVTFDDSSQYDVEYTWFNIGKDRAERTHKWNQNTGLSLLEETDLSARPVNEYTVQTFEEAVDAAYRGFQTQSSFSLYFQDPQTAGRYEEVLEQIRMFAYRPYSYSWNPQMLLLRIYLNP